MLNSFVGLMNNSEDALCDSMFKVKIRDNSVLT